MQALASVRGLRTFCVAAQCLSFKKAAEHLFLTPSAISHQIKQLEDQLGLNLFERLNRSIELTAVGKRFYKVIWPLMSQLDSIVSDFNKSQENSTITLNMPEFFASEVFVPRLSEWTEDNQEIDLKLETVKADNLAIKPSDLSIILSNGIPTANIVHKLFKIRYVPACNKQLWEKWSEEGYEALNSVPLIVHQMRPWAWHRWADKANIGEFNPPQIIQLDSMFAVARAAQKGMGIALIPMPISTSWFEEKLLFRLFEHDLKTNDRYFLIQNERAQNPQALSKFVDWAKETFQNYE